MRSFSRGGTQNAVFGHIVKKWYPHASSPSQVATVQYNVRVLYVCYQQNNVRLHLAPSSEPHHSHEIGSPSWRSLAQTQCSWTRSKHVDPADRWWDTVQPVGDREQRSVVIVGRRRNGTLSSQLETESRGAWSSWVVVATDLCCLRVMTMMMTMMMKSALCRHRIYSVSQKIHPCGFLTFSPGGWEFLIIFTNLLYIPSYTRLQIYIQLFPTLTKLCHTKRNHPANFLHFTRTLTSKFAYWANDVTVDVMSYPICLMTL